MKQTLRMLSAIITEDSARMSLTELATKYKKEGSPIYLATAFKKLYGLILQTSQRFYGLTQSDLASHALERLDFCLRTYDDESAAVTTYYSKLLYNRLREETESLNTHKRKAIFACQSIDALAEERH